MVQEIKKSKKQGNIFTVMAMKYQLEPDKFLATISKTIMPQRKDGKTATMEEIAAFLIVANKYNLNPYIKEIYAFPSKGGGIIPIVGIDGFITILNRQEMYDGMEVEFSEDEVTLEGAKQCPSWCEIRIFHKKRSKPTIVREYLDEVFRVTTYESAWKTHTKRMLRHKAMIQGIRIAFGITGIYDPDEAERIIEAELVEPAKKPDVAEPQALTSQEPPSQEPTIDLSTQPQQKAIHTLATKIWGKDQEKFAERLGADYGVESTKELTKDQAGKLIEKLSKELDGNK